MNFQAFREWRDQVLRSRSPLRLDCMNPAQALRHLVSDGAAPGEGDEAPALEPLLARWGEAVGTRLPVTPVMGRGVRDLLEAVFAWWRGAASGTVWVPEDVYPVYETLAKGCEIRTFPTLVDPGAELLGFLAATGTRDLVLLPSPLAPLGRRLRQEEVGRLRDWILEAPDRWLVIDAVYAYETPFDGPIAPLVKTGRCIALTSLSKTWLRPGLLGIGSVPAGLASFLQARCPLPDAGTRREIARALACLELPARQQRLFRARWQRLASRLNPLDPRWTPPETGYFSVLEIDAFTLLAHYDVLAVPASVFGARRTDRAVISCLHETLAEDRA